MTELPTAMLKARAPHREVVFGSISRSAPADLSTIVGMNACRRSAMYTGASNYVWYLGSSHLFIYNVINFPTVKI